MKIKKRKLISTIELEDYSIGEYNNFLKIKQLPSYELVGEKLFKINTQFLKLIDDKLGIESEKCNLKFNKAMFDYQIFITKLALLKKHFAVFADCGLGKTLIFLEWCKKIQQRIDDKKILIVSPLMVCNQTIEEERKFYKKDTIVNIHEIGFSKWLNSKSRIGIVNYDLFRNDIDFKGKIGAVVADESSALKSETSVIRTNLINACKGIEYKLACTATPAPNDRQEYANHALFLDKIRNYQEFFHRYFINRNDGWILKPHATQSFYKYLASFSVFLRSPAIYGFNDNLKGLKDPIIKRVDVELTKEQLKEVDKINKKRTFGFVINPDGMKSRTKFSQLAKGFIYTDKKENRRIKSKKPNEIVKLVNKHKKENILIWVSFDVEGDILYDKLKDKYNVYHLSGKTKKEDRIKAIEKFKNNKINIMISKPKLLGFGLNFQNCSTMIFSWVTDSYEQYYQALRRAHRYGNFKQLKVYNIITKLEKAMYDNVQNKKNIFEHDMKIQERLYKNNLIDDLIKYTNKESIKFMKKKKRVRIEKTIKNCTLIRNDNIEELESMDENSIDFSIFSPPFASLFTYSSDIADQGNCQTDEEFCLNYHFFAKRLFKVMKPGRKVCVHVSQLPILKSITGYVGIKDFRGLIYETMYKAGFQNTTEIVLSDGKGSEKIIIPTTGEIAIKKNQQMQSIVKHAPGLAMHIFRKNSLKCMPCFNDYILIFTKPGESENAVTPLKNGEMNSDDWIKYASGVWLINEEKCDIIESDTLNTKKSKNNEDAKHICPLQLEVYRRLIKLYSNPGEVVLEPFGGIGSGAKICVENNRKNISIELKKQYFNEMIKNIKKTKSRKVKKIFGGK